MTAAEISAETAIKLGLVDPKEVERIAGSSLATSYGLACQAIKAQGAFNTYVTPRIDAALASLRASVGDTAPLHGIASPTQALAWRAALAGWDVAQAGNRQAATDTELSVADAPTILQFWIEVCRLQDLSTFVNAKEASSLELSALSKGLPPLKDCQKAVLSICRFDAKADDGYKWVPIVSIWLRAGSSGELEAPPETQLVINHGEFFDVETEEPRADLDKEQVESWVALEEPVVGSARNDDASDVPTSDQGLPSQLVSTVAEGSLEAETWPEFFERWQRLTEYWLDRPDGLAGLCELLRGSSAKAFTVRFVDSGRVRSGGHAARLVKAAKDLDKLPLLKGVLDALAGQHALQETSLLTMDRGQFLGHMDEAADGGARKRAFPLDSTQRVAAMAVADLAFSGKHEALPVNGPPGTGKTSFLRAALASMWVRSALDKAPHPKVVYGIAATNQAVSNMIDAFGSIRGSELGDPSHSWLRHLPSYGWFYPSSKAAENSAADKLMHLLWNEEQRNPVTPGGSATEFNAVHLEVRKQELLECASAALGLPFPGLDLELVTERAHHRLGQLHKEMLERQAFGSSFLGLLPDRCKRGRRLAGVRLRLEHKSSDLSAQWIYLNEKSQLTKQALEISKLVLIQERLLNTGWRARLPQFLRTWIWTKELADLQSLRSRAQASLSRLHDDFPVELPLIESKIEALSQLWLKQATGLHDLTHAHESTEYELGDVVEARKDRRQTVRALLVAADLDAAPVRDQFRLVRKLFRWAVTGESQSPAYEALIHHLEAPLDSLYRVPMFHWAARYWECRWLAAQEEGAQINHARRIEQLMMLGVIIVATTHKVLKLGEYRQADLLVMDEAGQCLPEVAAACLTLASSAAFVGDVLQLQPVGGIPHGMQTSVERKVSPDAVLPDAVKPSRGSGMLMVREAATSGRSGEPGVTLLHHYRCMPDIIGYCNELMYGGKIVNARKKPRMAHLDWMPAMSWVAVPGLPRKDGTSWVNDAEVFAIVRWLVEEKHRLTISLNSDGESVTSPLASIVAIVTPLAKQAAAIRAALEEAIDPEEIKDMVIGTVHKLQGAERPVVLFSLVQNHTLSKKLMADRDGGNLMNVAVSRAQDAFVIFADRQTLKPAPADSQNEGRWSRSKVWPVARLGRYMRQRGTRLYPNKLVVVEAPGKRAAIEKSLGLQVAVLATGGHLKEASLDLDLGLVWGPSPPAWQAQLREHAGLVGEIVVATDDDLAGELIGLHAAEDALAIIGQASRQRPLRVRRMRFADMTTESLRAALDAAGDKFDAQRLAAALVRNFANLVDKQIYSQSSLPMRSYASAPVRDALDWLARRGTPEDSSTSESELDSEIICTIQTADGLQFDGFVAAGHGGLNEALRLDQETALAVAEEILGSVEPLVTRSVLQIPGLYPANTTARILALAVDELGMDPSRAQEHLNALYLQGAATDQEQDGGNTQTQ